MIAAAVFAVIRIRKTVCVPPFFDKWGGLRALERKPRQQIYTEEEKWNSAITLPGSHEVKTPD